MLFPVVTLMRIPLRLPLEKTQLATTINYRSVYSATNSTATRTSTRMGFNACLIPPPPPVHVNRVIRSVAIIHHQQEIRGVLVPCVSRGLLFHLHLIDGSSSSAAAAVQMIRVCCCCPDRVPSAESHAQGQWSEYLITAEQSHNKDCHCTCTLNQPPSSGNDDDDASECSVLVLLTEIECGGGVWMDGGEGVV